MPFPEKEIEETYETMLPIFQGHFREEAELYETEEEIQRIYRHLTRDMEWLKRVELDELIAMIRREGEYQSRHAYTEGWLTAKGEERRLTL